MYLLKQCARVAVMSILCYPFMPVHISAEANSPDWKDDCNNQGNACVSAQGQAYDYALIGLETERQDCLQQAETQYSDCNNQAEEDYYDCVYNYCGTAYTACILGCENTHYNELTACMQTWIGTEWYCSDRYDSQVAIASQAKENGICVCENQRAGCLNGCQH